MRNDRQIYQSGSFSAYAMPEKGVYSRKAGLNVFKVVGYGLALFSIVVALF